MPIKPIENQDTLVDAIVNDVAGAMATNAVSAKWQCVLEDLAPLVKDGKLEQVADIMMKYWPPDAEIEELKKYSLSEDNDIEIINRPCAPEPEPCDVD